MSRTQKHTTRRGGKRPLPIKKPSTANNIDGRTANKDSRVDSAAFGSDSSEGHGEGSLSFEDPSGKLSLGDEINIHEEDEEDDDGKFSSNESEGGWSSGSGKSDDGPIPYPPTQKKRASRAHKTAKLDLAEMDCQDSSSNSWFDGKTSLGFREGPNLLAESSKVTHNTSVTPQQPQEKQKYQSLATKMKKPDKELKSSQKSRSAHQQLTKSLEKPMAEQPDSSRQQQQHLRSLSPSSQGLMTWSMEYTSPKPDPTEMDQENEMSPSSWFDGNTSLNLGDGPASLTASPKVKIQKPYTEQRQSPYQSHQLPQLSPSIRDSPVAAGRRGRSPTPRSRPPPGMSPSPVDSSRKSSAREDNEEDLQTEDSESTITLSSSSHNNDSDGGVAPMHDDDSESEMKTVRPNIRHQSDHIFIHSNVDSTKDKNIDHDGINESSDDESDDETESEPSENADMSFIPKAAVPLYEPDALNNLVEDLFTPGESQSQLPPSRVIKCPLRARSADNLFTPSKELELRRITEQKTQTLDVAEYPSGPPDVAITSPSYTKEANLDHDDANTIQISPPQLPVSELEILPPEALKMQALDDSANSSSNDLLCSASSATLVENPWAQSPTTNVHDEATLSQSPKSAENPWAQALTADFCDEAALSQSPTTVKTPWAQTFPNDLDVSSSNGSTLSAHSLSQTDNPWAQTPTTPSSHQSPISYNAETRTYSLPMAPSLMHRSPYANGMLDDVDEINRGEGNSSQCDKGSLVSPAKSSQPGYPLGLAPQHYQSELDDQNRTTERFEDEASTYFGSLTQSGGEGSVRKHHDGDSYQPRSQGKESDKDISVSDLGDSIKRRWLPYRSTIMLAIGLICLLVVLAGIAGGILGVFFFGSGGQTEEVIVYVKLTSSPTEATTATPSVGPTHLSFNEQTISPSVSIPSTSEPNVPQSTTAPSIGASRILPTLPPTVQPTSVSTSVPTSIPSDPTSRLVTNQELYRTIAEVSFDYGASILVAESPQQRAFMWLQNDDNLTNSVRRRKMRGRGRLRQLAVSADEIIQRYSMAVFYFATNGDGWIRRDRWLDPDVHECEWYSDYLKGTGCSVFDKKMIRNLVFNLNGLTGSIPPELGLLTSLRRLEIVGDPVGACLGGSIPSQVGVLTNLDFLRIRGHRFNETLHDELFELLGLLTVVDFSLNQLPGQIPSSVANLTKARKLIFNDNEFVDGFPPTIAEIESMEVIELQNNFLEGKLPPSVANLTLIQLFDVSNNSFSGTLPDFSGWSTATARLDFSDNRFTGLLSDSFAALGDLETFRARNNLLSGDIPLSLASLESLVEMDISGNNLSGNITEAMCTAFNDSQATVSVDCGSVSCDCCDGC